MSEPWEAPSEPREQRGRFAYGQQGEQWHEGRQDRQDRQDRQWQQPEPSGRRDGYGQGRSATPYLERSPYSELSQSSLDREAAYPPQHDPLAARQDYGRANASRSRRPVKESNGIAVAGAVLFFVPLLGLLLSIIGLAKAGARGGGGRIAGTLGIVLSLLFTGGLGYGVYKISHSTAADAACLSADADVSKLTSTLSTDSAALSTASQSGDKSRFTAAANKFTNDIVSLEGLLTADEAKATHSNVRTAIGNYNSDLASLVSGMHQALGGDTSNEAATTQAVNRMQNDGDSIVRLCGNVANG